MAQPTVVCYPAIPESLRMRDLAGMREDLALALRYLEVIEKQIGAGQRDLTIWEGIASAALVAYARCFNEGVRERLPHAILDSAPVDLRETHQYVIALRNKHVAHSVNPYEDNHLSVEVALAGGQPSRIVDVGVKCRRLIGVADPDVPSIRALFEWLLEHVNGLYEVERERVLVLLSSKQLATISSQRMEPPYQFMEPGAHAKARRRE